MLLTETSYHWKNQVFGDATSRVFFTKFFSHKVLLARSDRLTSWRMVAALSIYWLSQAPHSPTFFSVLLWVFFFKAKADLEILVLGQLRGRVSSKLSTQWHMRLQQRLMAKLPKTLHYSLLFGFLTKICIPSGSKYICGPNPCQYQGYISLIL